MEFPGVLVFGLKISEGFNTICGISMGRYLLCLKFPGAKFNPLAYCLYFFSGKAQWKKFGRQMSFERLKFVLVSHLEKRKKKQRVNESKLEGPMSG